MRLTKEQAMNLAMEFVNRDPNLNINYTLSLMSVHASLSDGENWSAVFEVRTIEGHVLDGPYIIIVNDEKGIAAPLQEFCLTKYFLDTLIFINIENQRTVLFKGQGLLSPTEGYRFPNGDGVGGTILSKSDRKLNVHVHGQRPEC